MDFEEPPRTLASLTERQRDTSKWPLVHIPSIKGKKNRDRFVVWQNAIIDYMAGVSPTSICRTYQVKGQDNKLRNICKSELYYLRDRCLEEDKHGNLVGFPALLKYYRINERAGPLMALFLKHPELERYVQALFFKRKRELGQSIFESREPYKGLHKKFLAACRKLEITGDQFPFKPKDNGLKTLSNYFKRLMAENPAQAAWARDGEKAARKQGSGQDHVRRYATEPLETVEFDAHCMDALWTLKLWDEVRKRFVTKVLNRIWLLVIIDQFSRAVLGYYLCTKEAYNQYDVMRAIKHAVEPWKPMEFKAVKRFKYPPRGGFPSGVIDRYAWALWDLLIYDNAWANLAAKTREVIKHVVGSDVNAGPKYTSDHQPFVERFNGTFTKDIMQRLPNTTGKGPKDDRRQNPEKVALEIEAEVDEVRELTDISLGTYNVTPHSAHGDLSPMEVMDQFAADPDHIIKTLPQNRREQLTWLNVEDTRKVRGGLKQKRRPYIHFHGVNYTSQTLRGARSMAGKTIKLVYDPTQDIRSIAAYTPMGASLGVLKAKGQWAKSRHTLELRLEIMALKEAKKLFYQNHDDPVQVYIDHLNEKALKRKRARGKLLAAQELTGLSPNQTPIVTPSTKKPVQKTDERVTPEKKRERVYSHRKAKNE